MNKQLSKKIVISGISNSGNLIFFETRGWSTSVEHVNGAIDVSSSLNSKNMMEFNSIYKSATTLANSVGIKNVSLMTIETLITDTKPIEEVKDKLQHSFYVNEVEFFKEKLKQAEKDLEDHINGAK